MDRRYQQFQMALAKRTTMAKIPHSQKLKYAKQPMLFLVKIGKQRLKENKY